ncbi:MAG: hypothetical protein JNL96_21250 [Planctomycetaceae bacterium]|nr:hypothetical protein [Planctomycetaceae bacterium]
MRYQSSSGVSWPAYFAACGAFLLVMVCLSKLGGPNGPAEPGPTQLQQDRLREEFSRGSRQANEEWERQVLKEEAELAAKRAAHATEEREAWNELRLRSAGVNSEFILP